MAYIEPEYSYAKPAHNPDTVEGIRLFNVQGPWHTKSNASLSVLFAMTFSEISDYFSYDDDELVNIPEDIRGLRSYSVTGLKKGSRGGMEYHRIRQEILFAFSGKVKVEAEDVYGNHKEIILDNTTGICIPPFTLHTYEAMDNNSSNLVICNTLFNPDDPQTHDTYAEQTFRKLQEHYR
ncbi:MAG: WxcM-like domain-containing protein [Bacteroidales bacterium]|nr:WxcM-like domain-containing protein [Bacteroidales bacterium]